MRLRFVAPTIAIFGLALGTAIGACGGSGDSSTPTSNGDGGSSTDGGGQTEDGGSDASGADADAMAASDAGDGSAPRTVSRWVGTNVSGDMPYADVTYLLKPFDTAAAQKDANGYPIAGASGQSQTDSGFFLPSGMYTLVYSGTGTLAVSGIGAVQGAVRTTGTTHTATVAITGTPGEFGQSLNFAITNSVGQTVTGIHLYAPGIDATNPPVFHPSFLRLLKPFRALRFMGWFGTNDNTLTDWSERPKATSFGAAICSLPANNSVCQPYENIVELVNETGKDFWLNVPEHASDAFITSLATFLVQNLDFTRIAAARAAAGNTDPFQILVENANETWNTSFTAYQTFLDAAKMNTTRFTGVYDGTVGPSWMSGNMDLMRVGQYEADRLVHIATLLKAGLGTQSSAVAPVLGGWALGAVYSDVALRFIQAKYGAPKDYVKSIALAPYFGPTDDMTNTADLPTLFTSMNANIASMDAVFQDFKTVAANYQISVAGYEGGQGMTGTLNQPIKHLAQHDARMHTAYLNAFTHWKTAFGESLFMHFELANDGAPPESIYQYGYWGSIISTLEDPAVCGANLPTLTGTEMIDSVVHHCPKYEALAEQVP